MAPRGPELIRLHETPATERFLCDDGQVVDVRGHDGTQRRLAALAYFEERTSRTAKRGDILVRIAGSSLVRPGGLRESS